MTKNHHQSDIYRSKIHDLIPGGAHTYSKGDDQFPANAPAAIRKGKGAYVWDVDGNKYLDFTMGLASISLGHAYEPVIERVKSALEDGVNFQRPSYLELEMAEKFLALVPQHDMIKFAKNGSIVTTAAVKLARAYTGRKLIAFPHDHPFYSYDDWFIGKTQSNFGIPEEVKSLSVTYKADDFQSLSDLFDQYPGQIACVISEPEKWNGIPEGYLAKAIDLAHKHGALYIVDEMLSGFKTDFPGSIKKYNVKPDMTTWGKGIANGFSFCCLTGIKEVMELGGIRNKGKEKLFLISTTHGGETHTMAACMATIDEFQKHNVVKHNQEIGDYFIQQCRKVISAKGLSDYITVTDSNWMPFMYFKNKKGEVDAGLRTLVLQSIIEQGILFQGLLVPCFSHAKNDIDIFAHALKNTLTVYQAALEDGYAKYLKGEVIQPVFRKYI